MRSAGLVKAHALGIGLVAGQANVRGHAERQAVHVFLGGHRAHKVERMLTERPAQHRLGPLPKVVLQRKKKKRRLWEEDQENE